MINSDKIPTAEEFLENQKLKIPHNLDRDGIAYPSTYCHQKMIQFAQFHVEAALKAAWENWEFEEGCDTHGVSLKEESILNAYPKENIL